MLPVIQEIERENGGRLHVIRRDIEGLESAHWIDVFHVHSTPTYILYNEDNQLVFQSRDFANSTVLHRKIAKETGSIQFPKLPSDVSDNLHVFEQSDYPLALLSFQSSKAAPLKEAKDDTKTNESDDTKYLQSLTEIFPNQLQTLRLNADHKAIRAYMKTLKLKDTPAHVLVDRDGVPYKESQQVMDRKLALSYMRLIQLLLNSLPDAEYNQMAPQKPAVPIAP